MNEHTLSHASRPTARIPRRLATSLSLVVAVACAGCTEASQPPDVAAAEDAGSDERGPSDRTDQLTSLATCFTTGMDEIGDNDVGKAKSRFAGCYTKDAASEVTFPNGTKAPFVGADAWADFIDGFFHQSKGYVRTQHLAGNVRVEEPASGRADVSFDMNALHVFPNGLYDQGHGRVRISAARHADGSWRIVSLSLKILQFNTIGDERAPLAAVVSCASAGLDAAAEQDVARAKARLATCFAPDAAISWATVAGQTAQLVGPAAFAEAALGGFAGCTAAQLESGEPDIVVTSGTEATLRSALTWRCRTAAGAVESRHMRVVDTVRRPGPADSTQPYTWTITKRVVTPTVHTVTP